MTGQGSGTELRWTAAHSLHMDLQLKGKTALVTGSSKGLGLASAKALAAEGCRVCICARTADRLEKAAGELRQVSASPDAIVSVAADLATAEGAEKVVSAAVKAFGGVDILVNNVGSANGNGIVDTPDSIWEDAFDQTLYPARDVATGRAADAPARQRVDCDDCVHLGA